MLTGMTIGDFRAKGAKIDDIRPKQSIFFSRLRRENLDIFWWFSRKNLDIVY